VTDQNSIIDTVASTRYPVYTRLNANDVMPDPVTPLGASLMWIPEILPAWAVGNVRLRYFTPEEMTPNGPKVVLVSRSTVCGPLAPAPSAPSPTTKRIAPATGCESAETTR